MLEILYGLSLLGVNFFGHEYYKNFSKIEKTGVLSAAAFGIDSLFTPLATGGKTLHQTLIETTGLSVNETVEYGIKVGEMALAIMGLTYQVVRPTKIRWDEKTAE